MTPRRAVVCALVLAVSLAGCASIPHEGDINYGDLEDVSTETFFPFAEGPRLGDDPGAIVRGFLTASVTGVASDFAVAREFLTDEASLEWNPNAKVTVFDSGALIPDINEDTGTVTYAVPVALVVDDSGRMRQGRADEQQKLTYGVALGADEQWRISALDDGVLIAEATFNRFYRPVELVFASADGTTMVTETRWFPHNNTATHAARELIEGPSPWLADAVETGFPAGSSLDVQSVVVTDGIAAVQLSTDSAGTPAQRSLAEEQLRLTLTALPDVTEVSVTVGGLPIGGDGSASLSRPPTPGALAAVVVQGRLGLWDETDLWVVPQDAGTVPSGVAGVAFSYDHTSAALLVGRSRVVAADHLAGGTASLERVDPEAELATPDASMEVREVYSGSSLVEPSFDRHGWIWTAERDAGEGLIAVAPDGTLARLEVRDFSGRTIQAIAVSRDGARVVVLSRVGAEQQVDVLGVVRAADGTPRSLGEPFSIAVGVTAALDVTWLDDVSVAVMGAPTDSATRTMWEITVGGRTVAQELVGDATSLTARYGDQSLTVVSSDGSVRRRSGTGWTAVVEGVGELAYAG